MKQLFAVLAAPAVLAALVLLSACGGGGSGDTSTNQNPPTRSTDEAIFMLADRSVVMFEGINVTAANDWLLDNTEHASWGYEDPDTDLFLEKASGLYKFGMRFLDNRNLNVRQIIGQGRSIRVFLAVQEVDPFAEPEDEPLPVQYYETSVNVQSTRIDILFEFAFDTIDPLFYDVWFEVDLYENGSKIDTVVVYNEVYLGFGYRPIYVTQLPSDPLPEPSDDSEE